MVTQKIAVVRSGIARAAGLNVGILVMNPNAADPAARIGIRESETGQRLVAEIRPGDRVTFAGRTIIVTGVTPGPRPVGRVELEIEAQEATARTGEEERS